jgi:hypothetical protein
MKSIKLTDVGALRNELMKYKSGKKLDINQFNQVARLAWLGKIVMQRLDPADPECKAYLLYVEPPDALAAHFLDTDEELLGRIHILDGEQGDALAKILEQGVHDRAALVQDLARRDFYFRHFFKKDDEEG